MKKFFLPALFAMVTLSACGQQNDVDRFYDKMKSSDALSGEISISPSLWLATSFSDKGDNNWKDKVSMVRLLILDGKKTPSVREEVDELSRELQNDHFDALLDIRKGSDQHVQLLEKDESGDKRNLVLLIRGQDNGVVFAQLKGRFTADDMTQIERSLNEHQ